jgi:hypothetical protein
MRPQLVCPANIIQISCVDEQVPFPSYAFRLTCCALAPMLCARSRKPLSCGPAAAVLRGWMENVRAADSEYRLCD